MSGHEGTWYSWKGVIVRIWDNPSDQKSSYKPQWFAEMSEADAVASEDSWYWWFQMADAKERVGLLVDGQENRFWRTWMASAKSSSRMVLEFLNGWF